MKKLSLFGKPLAIVVSVYLVNVVVTLFSMEIARSSPWFSAWLIGAFALLPMAIPYLLVKFASDKSTTSNRRIDYRALLWFSSGSVIAALLQASIFYWLQGMMLLCLFVGAEIWIADYFLSRRPK